jgi:Type II secretion system (T2SS), protein M subtype b
VSPRVWRIGGIAAAVLVLVAAWFALVSPTLQKAEALNVEAASQQAASDQLRSRISLLKKQSEELPAQEAKLASIQQRLPSTAALPTLIRNLTTVAENADVIVASVTPGRPTPVAQPAPPAPPPSSEEDAAADDSGDADSADSQDAGTSSSAAAPAAPQGPQVEAMTLNITACGTFAQLRSYLRELEQMKRVVSVSGLQVSKGACADGAAEDDLTATVQAYVFTLPNVTIDTTGSDATATAESAATKGEGDE